MSASGYAAAVDRLITALGRLPGIGAKSAERLAHHLLRCPAEEALELADAIRAAKEQIHHCQVCFHLTEADQPLCAICRDPRRDQTTVCVVEQSRDLIALEKAGTFHGVYHVLLGRLAPLSGHGPRTIDHRCPGRTRPVRNHPRADHGHQSQPRRRRHALLIANRLGESGVRITRLARGLASGSTLEFANRDMLADAFTGRQPF